MNRYTKVRELVKDPSLTIKDIAQQTGYDKGHVSRLRKASQQFKSGLVFTNPKGVDLCRVCTSFILHPTRDMHRTNIM